MINRKKHSDKSRANQGVEEVIAEPNKIGPTTPYDFEAKNLTAYGGLLPVATMLENISGRMPPDWSFTTSPPRFSLCARRAGYEESDFPEPDWHRLANEERVISRGGQMN